MNASRSPLENLNGLVVILGTFFASTQIFNLLIPDAGLPFLLFNVFFFVLLLNTFAGALDRSSVLRSLAVILGAAFILKFVVLSALSDPIGGALKRVLLALLEGITLGTLTQPPLHRGNGLSCVCDTRAVSDWRCHAGADQAPSECAGGPSG